MNILIIIAQGLLLILTAQSMYYLLKKKSSTKLQSVTVLMIVMVAVMMLSEANVQIRDNSEKTDKVFVVASTNSNGITVEDPTNLSLEDKIILCDSTGLAVNDLVDGSGKLVLEAKYVYRIGD